MGRCRAPFVWNERMLLAGLSASAPIAITDGSGRLDMCIHTNAPAQSVDDVATGVCQKEEAAGWLPS